MEPQLTHSRPSTDSYSSAALERKKDPIQFSSQLFFTISIARLHCWNSLATGRKADYRNHHTPIDRNRDSSIHSTTEGQKNMLKSKADECEMVEFRVTARRPNEVIRARRRPTRGQRKPTPTAMFHQCDANGGENSGPFITKRGHFSSFFSFIQVTSHSVQPDGNPTEFKKEKKIPSATRNPSSPENNPNSMIIADYSAFYIAIG